VPRKPKTPKITYHHVAEDEAAVEAVYNMLFEKVLEQKVAEKQATKARKNDKSPGKSET